MAGQPPEFVAEFKGRGGGTFVLDPSALGPPGLSHTLHVVEQRLGEPDRGPDPLVVTPRQFHVWAAIVEQAPIYDADLHAEPSGGDCLIEFDAAGFGIKAGPTSNPTDAVDLRFHANQGGRLAAVDGLLVATTYEEARGRFLLNANTMLSIFTWDHQLPLALASVGGRDPANGITHVEYTSPLRVDRKFVKPGIGGRFTSDFLAAFSFFREGLANPSPAYRVICFDKTMAMLRRIRGTHERALRDRGQGLEPFCRAAEVVVENADLAVEVWPDVVGWRLHRLHDDRLHPLRNQAAHELLDDEAAFTNLDSPARRSQFRAAADAFVPLVHRYGTAIAAAMLLHPVPVRDAVEPRPR